MVELPIDNPGFFGRLVQRPGTGPVLALPSARPDGERDVVVRTLLGWWTEVPLAPLPACMELTELSGA